ncbi:hypothetical protein Sros01_80040 [Streptomyces roseochromogenus]|nr:hypothetical protein Sros01_80040 [Streptomyces roseochromogenus]
MLRATRARFGYTAAAGTADDGRMRHLAQALSPAYAARLFEAQEQGATEEQLLDIAAEGFKRSTSRTAAAAQTASWSNSPTSTTSTSSCSHQAADPAGASSVTECLTWRMRT